MGAALRTKDVTQALRMVNELHRSADIDDFARRVCGMLRSLIDCEVVGYNELDRHRSNNRVVGDPSDAVFPGMLEVIAAHIHEHPVLRYFEETGDNSAIKLTDLTSLTAFRRTALFDELYRPLAIDSQIILNIAARPSLTIGVAMFRGGSDFTERDRELLDLLEPLIAQAYETTEAREVASATTRILERTGQSVVTLDRDLRIVEASPAAQRALYDCYRLPLGAETLPNDLLNSIARSGTTSGLGGMPERTILKQAGNRSYTFRFMPASNAAMGAMLLIASRPAVLSPEDLAPLGLSARQTEVLCLTARGLSNAQIGDELFISPRTVKRHLEAIYDRLGVRTRTAAVAAALVSAR